MNSVTIIDKLEEKLKTAIKNASEIYIAVALINNHGVNLLKKASSSSLVHIVCGINLPTPIDVLKQLKKKLSNDVRIYTETFFHPKVYLFKFKDNSYIAYVGSGNFTQGGLIENVELSVEITDQEQCHKLKEWHDTLFSKSELITNHFLEKYKDYYDNWHPKKIQQEKEIKIIQAEINISANTEKLIAVLKKERESPEYAKNFKERQIVVQRLKKETDYKNGFQHFDVDGFLDIGDLGHILPFFKLTLKKHAKNGKIKKLCQMLCDEKISVSERYRLAQNEYKVEGCSRNFITKILTIHNPKEYFLWNDKTESFLKHFGVCFKRGTKEWDKYETICKFFKHLCEETGIDDFAVLDKILYEITNKLSLKDV